MLEFFSFNKNDTDDVYESLPTSCMSTHMIAGAMAGMMEHVLMFPLDSVKVRYHLGKIF